jgi:hypothetical protein
MLTNAGLAATVDVTMAADQLGVGYAEQLTFLSGLVPFWDLVVAQLQLSDPSWLNTAETKVNNALGSANPNSV